MVLIVFLALGLAVASRVIAQCENNSCPNLYTSCKNPNTVALTFDDGPYNWLPEIVDQLDAAGAKGTFFVNGQNWNCIYNAGSHTWAHRNLSNLTFNQIHDEMFRTEVAIQRITGALVGFMRPPFGSYNDMVYNISVSRGQKVVLWDFDPGDSVGKTPEESKRLYDEVVTKHPQTILSVHHETHNTTVFDVLPYAIGKLQSSGYQLVTVAECLNLTQSYQNIGPPETPNGNWTC